MRAHGYPDDAAGGAGARLGGGANPGRAVVAASLAASLRSGEPAPPSLHPEWDFPLAVPPVPADRAVALARAFDEDVGGRHAPALRRLARELPAVLDVVERARGDERVAGVARWQVCAAARVLELHGALGAVTAATAAAAERHVEERVRCVVDGRSLLPADAGFVVRARRFRRAQAPLLDHLLDRLFDPVAPPADLGPAQRGAIYVTTWIGVHALDAVFVPAPLPSEDQP